VKKNFILSHFFFTSIIARHFARVIATYISLNNLSETDLRRFIFHALLSASIAITTSSNSSPFESIAVKING